MIFTTYTISQILIVIAFALMSATYFAKSRPYQLMLMIGSNIFMVLGFGFFGAYIASAMSMVGILRDSTSLYLYKQKAPANAIRDRFLLILWLIISTIFAVFTYKNFGSFLPYAASIIYIISIWQKNIFIYRLIGIPFALLWLAFHIVIGNPTAFILEFIFFMFILIGFTKYLKEQRNIKRYK